MDNSRRIELLEVDKVIKLLEKENFDQVILEDDGISVIKMTNKVKYDFSIIKYCLNKHGEEELLKIFNCPFDILMRNL